MNKSLILALFLGLAASSKITGWTGPSDAADGGRYNIINSPDWLTFSLFYEVDIGYQTHYTGHAPDQLATGIQGESYGINAYSYLLLQTETTSFKNHAMETQKMYIEPIMVAPYTQTIYWTRPEAQIGNHFFLAGTREVRIGNYATFVEENVKIGKQSLYQVIANQDSPLLEESEIYYELDSQNKFMDPYQSGNLIDQISSDTFTNLQSKSWYGLQDYYNMQLY
eukprot:403367108